MNRTLYTLLFHLGLPLVFLRLLWRAWRAPASVSYTHLRAHET